MIGILAGLVGNVVVGVALGGAATLVGATLAVATGASIVRVGAAVAFVIGSMARWHADKIGGAAIGEGARRALQSLLTWMP